MPTPPTDDDALAERQARDWTEAASDASIVAVLDVLSTASESERPQVLDWLRVVLAGTSPDEVATLAAVAVEGSLVYGQPPMSPDDELVDNWPQAPYPYRNTMRRACVPTRPLSAISFATRLCPTRRPRRRSCPHTRGAP